MALGTIEVAAPASGFLVGFEPRFQVFDAPGLFDDMHMRQRVFTDPEVRERLATFGSAKGMEPIVGLSARSADAAVAQGDPRGGRISRARRSACPGRRRCRSSRSKNSARSPVSMPLGEVLSAMQNRTIDGLIARRDGVHGLQIL